MSLRYKVDGPWDDQLPPDLREPYAIARATSSAYGVAPLGSFPATLIGGILVAAAVGSLYFAVLGPNPATTTANRVLVGVLVVCLLLLALVPLHAAWARWVWARRVTALTGVNPRGWDVTKPLPTRGRPDIPLRRQG